MKNLSVQRPESLPCTLIVVCERSVEAVVPQKNFEENGKLNFIIGRTIIGSPVCERRLTFSYERAPVLDHQFFPAGEIEPGKMEAEERTIFLFLEKSCHLQL